MRALGDLGVCRRLTPLLADVASVPRRSSTKASYAYVMRFVSSMFTCARRVRESCPFNQTCTGPRTQRDIEGRRAADLRTAEIWYLYVIFFLDEYNKTVYIEQVMQVSRVGMPRCCCTPGLIYGAPALRRRGCGHYAGQAAQCTLNATSLTSRPNDQTLSLHNMSIDAHATAATQVVRPFENATPTPRQAEIRANSLSSEPARTTCCCHDPHEPELTDSMVPRAVLLFPARTTHVRRRSRGGRGSRSCSRGRAGRRRRYPRGRRRRRWVHFSGGGPLLTARSFPAAHESE